VVWIQGLSHNYLVNGVLNFSIWNWVLKKEGKRKKSVGWRVRESFWFVLFCFLVGLHDFSFRHRFFTRYGRIEIDALINLRFARSQRWRIRAITGCARFGRSSPTTFELTGKFGYPSSLKEKARSFLFWTIIGDPRLRSYKGLTLSAEAAFKYVYLTAVDDSQIANQTKFFANCLAIVSYFFTHKPFFHHCQPSPKRNSISISPISPRFLIVFVLHSEDIYRILSQLVCFTVSYPVTQVAYSRRSWLQQKPMRLL